VVRGVAEGQVQARRGDTCRGEVVALSPEDTVEEGIRLIRERAIRRIPVVEGGNAVGIVSIGDLAIERDEQSALGAQDRSVHVRWPVASGPLLSDRKRRRPRMVASCSST